MLRAGGRMSYQVHFYKRLSANSFDTTAQTTTIEDSLFANGFIVGDVNGDGFKDLIVKHLASPLIIKTYLNDGTGKFTTTAPPLSANEIILAASDLNGDGKDDLIVSDLSQIRYRLTQPDNSFGDAVNILPVGGTIEQGRQLVGLGYIWVNSFPVIVEDLNNDGHKDIAYVRQVATFEHELIILTNNGDLTFTPSPAVPFAAVITRLRAFDLNNDGKKDFISDFGPNNGARVAVNNGDNTFTVSSLAFPDYLENRYAENYKTKNFIAADFDNDGDIDIIYPGAKAYRYFENQGNATFSSSVIMGYPGLDHTADLDGDGRTDGVFLNYSVINNNYRLWDGNNWRYYYLHNTVGFRKNQCGPAGQTKVIDFDGDGIVDRTFWNPQTGVWRYYPSTFFNNSYLTTSLGSGNLGDVPVPNDYDGDGKTDAAVYRKSNGTWWINGSGGTTISGFNFGLPEDKPVPADYDGDGRADIAVYRPSTGVWHFWLSGTNQYTAVHWGIDEDKPMPVDYDGDGKADIAVFRPSTGVWYVFKSSDSSAFIVQWGLGTDIPVPGDYDGDGKADITVYRDGLWYVLRSDFSFSPLYWGIAGDVPFFNDSLQTPSFGVFRASNSNVYISSQQETSGGPGQPSGNTANEIFVSSILPPQ
jgi:hypothetical protein